MVSLKILSCLILFYVVLSIGSTTSELPDEGGFDSQFNLIDLDMLENCLDKINHIYYFYNLSEIGNDFYEEHKKYLQQLSLGDTEIDSTEFHCIMGDIYNYLGKSEKSKASYRKALDTASVSSNIQIISDIYNNLGMYYHRKEDYETALSYFYEALHHSQNNNDNMGLLNTKLNLGSIHDRFHDDISSLNYYLTSYQLSKKYNYPAAVIVSLNNIGNIHYGQKSYEKALNYYSKCFSIIYDILRDHEEFEYLRAYEERFNTPEIRSVIRSLQKSEWKSVFKYFITLLYNTAIIYEELDLNSLSEEVNLYALSVAKIVGDSIREASILNNLGYLYLKEDRTDSALIYFQRSYDIYRMRGDNYGVSFVLMDIGNLYYLDKKYEKSLQYLEEGYTIALENDYVELINYGSNVLKDLFEDMGNYEKALLYYRDYHETNSRILNIEKVRELTRLDLKHSFENTLRELTEQHEKATTIADEKIKFHKRITFVALIISILVIMLIFVLLSFYRIKKKANKLLEAKNHEIFRQKNELEQRNITLQKTMEELKAAYSRLEKTQKELVLTEQKNAALAVAITANHEINQPLLIIQGNLELIKLKLGDDSQFDKYLDSTNEAINRISEILKKMRELENSHKINFLSYADNVDMIDINDGTDN